MKINALMQAGVSLGAALVSLICASASAASGVGTGDIKHVLLLSIDGMHAVDFYNCSHGCERRQALLPQPVGVEP